MQLLRFPRGALLTDLSLYRKLIGKLNSLQYTRLDISVFYTRVTLCLNQGTGPTVYLVVSLLMVMFSFLVVVLFHGNPRSIQLLPSSLLRLSIRLFEYWSHYPQPRVPSDSQIVDVVTTRLFQGINHNTFSSKLWPGNPFQVALAVDTQMLIVKFLVMLEGYFSFV
uniref:Uncharacterized protein n=1 Tax=Solanum lycopersicum TaxID=4081 RepID=A0A3Q7EY27_SOLLC